MNEIERKDQTMAGIGTTRKSNLRLCVLVAVVFFQTTVFADDNRGTPQQRAACTPDAFRLCAGYIPDAGRVENCLRQKKFDLSGPCRSVFDRNASSAVNISK